MIEFGNMKYSDFLLVTKIGDETKIQLLDVDISGKKNKIKNLRVLRTYLDGSEVFFLMQGDIDGYEHVFKISDLNFFYLLESIGCKKESKFEDDFVFIERLNELFLIPAKSSNPFYTKILDLKKEQIQLSTVKEVKNAKNGTVYLNKKGVICVYLGSFYRLSGNINNKGYATGNKVYVSVPLNTLTVSKNYNVLNAKELKNLTMSDLIIESSLKMFSAENQTDLFSDISSEEILNILNTIFENTQMPRLKSSGSTMLKSLFRKLVDNRFNLYDLKKTDYIVDSDNNNFVDLLKGLFDKCEINNSVNELTRYAVNSFQDHIRYLFISEAKMLFRINTEHKLFATRKDFVVYNIVDKESKIYSNFFKFLDSCNEHLGDYFVYYRKYLTQGDKYIVDNFVTVSTNRLSNLKEVLNLTNIDNFVEKDKYFSNTVRNLDENGNVTEIYTEIVCTPNSFLLDME